MQHLSPRKYRSPEVWAQVRAAYLAGEPAPLVCRRFDVGVANLRRRAKAEGWTRLQAALRNDGGATTAAALPTLDAIDEPTYFVTPKDALVRASHRAAWLLSEGRAAEADAMVRAARNLADLVERHALDAGVPTLRMRKRRP